METGHFMTPDGLKIYTRYWPQEGDLRAVILLVHGLGEHSGRYQHVAEYLNAAGYAIYTLDHRGHGQSAGGRAQVTHKRQFIDDLHQYYQTIRQQHPDDKLFIIGHSMGSVISLHFVYTYPDLIDALVVTGTATDVASTVPPLVRRAADLIHVVLPHFQVQGALSDPATLTSDPEFQAQWRADSDVNKGGTPASIAKYILETGEMLQANAAQITLPILIMHGESDVIAPVSGSRIMYSRVGSEDKTLVTWPDMQHEILNERERAAVLARLLEWLNQH